MKFSLLHHIVAALFMVIIITSGCSSTPSTSEGKIRVIATTTIVGDVVHQIGGDRIELSVLIPANVDEHSFEPTARDIAKASEAEIIFMNGAGLEQFIDRVVENAAGNASLVSVSDGLTLMESPAHEHEGEEEHGHAEDHEGEGLTGDPHVWTDPNNVLTWVDNIEAALVKVDSKNAAFYQENADGYRRQLQELDTWVAEQVALVPVDKRRLVTDHLFFTYFANRYEFVQVGAIIPGYSTASSPSAQELAALEDQIKSLNVPVIFVGATVNQSLASRVANDTGTKLVQIYTGSLTDADGPASSYIDYIRYNVNAIVTAIK